MNFSFNKNGVTFLEKETTKHSYKLMWMSSILNSTIPKQKKKQKEKKKRKRDRVYPHHCYLDRFLSLLSMYTCVYYFVYL